MSLGLLSLCSKSDDDQDSEIGNQLPLEFLQYSKENPGNTGGDALGVKGGSDDGFHLFELSLEDDEFKTGRDPMTHTCTPQGTSGTIQGLVECENIESHCSLVTFLLATVINPV
jgi:hypothetical protein